MASEAYKRMMKKIPKEIQQQVDFNLEVADEIYLTLEQKGLKPVDLAKKLNKSESEISKWLTGTHNFTLKTIQKIDLALGTKILITNSSKIEGYEKEKAQLQKENKRLKEKCAKLEKLQDGLTVFDHLTKVEGTLGKKMFQFNTNKEDFAKIKSGYKPKSFDVDYVH